MEYLATRGYDPAFGARPVKRVVQQELETALAKGILRGDFAVGAGLAGAGPPCALRLGAGRGHPARRLRGELLLLVPARAGRGCRGCCR